MNLPNKLSLARIAAIPGFLVLLLGGDTFGDRSAHLAATACYGLALVLTIAVAITDWLDGKIAREQGLITNLGKLLDPLADKVFVAAALVAFVGLDLIPSWTVVLILTREFLITGLRGIATEAGRVIHADRTAKHKTGWQLGLIITGLVLMTAREALLHAGLWHDPVVTQWAGALVFQVMLWIPLVVTLVLTVLSAWWYLAANRDLLNG
jgi:CDP-diacylglycerol--glycerol-3-phosphate 3-phosphatidyltransferase